jgi:hypothetical protein
MIGNMPEDLFDALEMLLRSRSPQAGFELLISKFREEKKYALVFEARLMQSRYALGLPLMQKRTSRTSARKRTKPARTRLHRRGTRGGRIVPGRRRHPARVALLSRHC